MKLLHLQQGTQEWINARAKCECASDAPAVLGCSPYKTRAQLLREKHTGVPADIDIATQKRFDNGHRAEALARPLAEEFVGAELFPAVCVSDDGTMLASMDGLTLDETTGFEHKALNAELRVIFASGTDDMDGSLLPQMHRVQMEMQFMVTGCQRILFMCSEWTADGELVEEHHCWYYPDQVLQRQIAAAWIQFRKDLAAYVLPEPAPEPARAEPMESLPAVSVRLDGALSVVGNLPSFAEALRAFVARIPKQPATDSDFATTEAACKALKRAEEALDAAEAGALASITDVESMRRAVADCRKLARDTRLAAEKLVDRRKLEIKEQAVMAARRALNQHVADLEGELAPMRLAPDNVDFAGAIKGLRSIASMQDALDTALANGKIAADAQARQIRANVATFKGAAAGLEFLFADLGQIVHKASDDFAALLHSRIAQHRIAEQARESARKKADEERIAAEAQQVAAAPSAAPVAHVAVSTPPAPSTSARGNAARADEPATLKLGTICERLGFTVSAAFLADTLGLKPARTDGAAKLYRQSDFERICLALQGHVERVRLAQREEVAA